MRFFSHLKVGQAAGKEIKSTACPFLFVVGTLPHVNTLGDNILLTDDSQNVLVRYEYDVFGGSGTYPQHENNSARCVLVWLE